MCMDLFQCVVYSCHTLISNTLYTPQIVIHIFAFKSTHPCPGLNVSAPNRPLHRSVLVLTAPHRLPVIRDVRGIRPRRTARVQS